MPFSEHPGGDCTFFGPLSVAFEGGIINSVDISLFHFAFTKLFGFYLCFYENGSPPSHNLSLISA